MADLLLRDEVYAVVGAAMTVQTELGTGFLEAVYQEAMEIELSERRIPFQPQVELAITYRGRQLSKKYCADLICYGEMVVELKAINELTAREEAQMLNYLKATNLRVGVLINFGKNAPLDWQRIVR